MFLKKPYLRPLLILLSAGGVVLTSALLLSVMLVFQKQNIEGSLLNNNQAYAQKLADTTDRYLQLAQRELAWGSQRVDITNSSNAINDLTQLNLQPGLFNSLGVVNNKAMLIASSPALPALIGRKLHSDTTNQVLATRVPRISKPFTSVAGNLMIMLTHPIMAKNGDYLGFIAGSIYLRKHSILSDILSLHFFGNSIFVTVVDDEGRIIYSSYPDHIDSTLSLPNQVKNALRKNESGNFIEHNKDQDNLVGYASVSETDWNIFVSTPADTVSSMLRKTLGKTLAVTLAILLLVSGGVAFLSSYIARPLEQLAGHVRNTDSLTTPEQLSTIKAWYQEADLLLKAIQNNFRKVSARMALLNDEAMCDPLTKLFNRRGFYEQATQFNDGIALFAIALDIDHFKKINDRFGHDIGDAVLIRLADLLRQTCRDGDIISRFGGEEFIVLLFNTDLHAAITAAERIRHVIATADFPEAISLTISAGLSGQTESGSCGLEQLLREADIALYQAKRQGRNRLIVNEALS